MLTRTLLMLTLSSLVATAQTPTHQSAEAAPPTIPQTKLERFATKTGIVIVRSFETSGKLNGDFGTSVTIESREYLDASTGSHEYGVSFELSGPRNDSHTAYIDYDEIDGLLKGLDYIQKVTPTTMKLKEFQADFKTRGGLIFSMFSTEGDVRFAAEAATGLTTTAYLHSSDAPRMTEILTKAKARLDAIRGPAK